jgi:hypothetical protein
MEEKIEELVARMKAAGEDQDFIDATIAKLRGLKKSMWPLRLQMLQQKTSRRYL